MTPDSSSEHLADLRRRWQAEPGSRLFLQLAEEYRRADRHGEAVEVLEKGLEQHPNHVSAHVALGRVRLDMGEPGNAAQALERALELDVTNLVANKLLIEAYLGRGEKERARQRLDLYRLLNDSDPDVADLRRRIDGGRSAAPPPPPAGQDTDGAADETAAGIPSAPDEVLAEGRSWGGEATADSLEPPSTDTARAAAAADPTATATDTAVSDTASAGDRGAGDALEEEPMTTGAGPADEQGAREAGPGTAASAGGSEPRTTSGGEPFGDLAAGGAERRYLQGLGGEGLFPLPPESLPEPRPAEIEALTEAGAPGGATGESAAAAPAPAAAEPASFAPQPVGTEPAAAMPPPPQAAPATPPIAAGAVEGPAAEAATAAEPAGTAEPAAPAWPPGERPTVTLGQLYLDQGHFAEARRVFAALLDEEPDHEVARRGLDRAERELAASGPQPVTAAELLREADPEQPARRAVLGAYLARILRSRESRPSDVPR